MDSAEFLKIVKKDIRQTQAWADFIEYKGYKTIVLNNNSFIHEFSLGPISIIKSFRPELTEESFKEIQSIADKKTNLLCKLSPNFDFDPLLKNKYLYENINSTMTPSRTCVRDLTEDYNKIFNSFSENTRYKINRSIREKDRIEVIRRPNSKLIDIFCDNLEHRQESKKFITFQRNEIQKLNQNFKDNSYLITAYDKNNNLIVSNLYFTVEDKVTYFAGSLNTENHKSKAGFQLIHEALQFFKSQGFKMYDFEGLSDERDPETYNDWLGYTNFKLKFGNKILEYPTTIIKYNNYIFKQMVKAFGI